MNISNVLSPKQIQPKSDRPLSLNKLKNHSINLFKRQPLTVQKLFKMEQDKNIQNQNMSSQANLQTAQHQRMISNIAKYEQQASNSPQKILHQSVHDRQKDEHLQEFDQTFRQNLTKHSHELISSFQQERQKYLRVIQNLELQRKIDNQKALLKYYDREIEIIKKEMEQIDCIQDKQYTNKMILLSEKDKDLQKIRQDRTKATQQLLNFQKQLKIINQQ
ncbi:hypothetical protein pb186bvf_011101 [Paramecium bursaria]